MPANGHKPTPTAFDLDALERERTPEAFPIVLGGKEIILKDAQELDWQTLMVAMGDPHYFFKLIVPEDNHDDFFFADFPTWKMRALMEAYTKHYGLASPGEANASRR